MDTGQLLVDEVEAGVRHARRKTRRNAAARHPTGRVLAATALLVSTRSHCI
jgi:hypothetical protein